MPRCRDDRAGRVSSAVRTPASIKALLVDGTFLSDPQPAVAQRASASAQRPLVLLIAVLIAVLAMTAGVFQVRRALSNSLLTTPAGLLGRKRSSIPSKHRSRS